MEYLATLGEFTGSLRGTVDRCWLHTKQLSHLAYNEQQLQPGTLEDGIYLIAASGSYWAYVKNDRVHCEFGHQPYALNSKRNIVDWYPLESRTIWFHLLRSLPIRNSD